MKYALLLISLFASSAQAQVLDVDQAAITEKIRVAFIGLLKPVEDLKIVSFKFKDFSLKYKQDFYWMRTTFNATYKNETSSFDFYVPVKLNSDGSITIGTMVAYGADAQTFYRDPNRSYTVIKSAFPAQPNAYPEVAAEGSERRITYPGSIR